jgi:Protein of unknown function (DUF1553)/Protein of unknown function (DUF1549)/Planctomycete cytochrome C
MTCSRRWFGLILLLPGTISSAGRAVASEPIDYIRQVKPILKGRCYACHGALKTKAGLRLDTGAAIRRGGKGGVAIELGRPAESLLIERLTAEDAGQRMPPEGAPLTAEQIATLRVWIDQGANSPPNEPPEADPRRHWAFLPPARPALPTHRGSSRVRNPIDAFLAAEHEKRGLTPLPRAEPNVLLRRVYLDLIGLPPTRAQLHAFLADPSEEAYERVVDQLLASPQYGERWARHWMDVWRYSDWYGRRAVPDVLNSYAMIWRWRDWIVRSLNEDKGYDRMVCEMLAADEIAPTDDANLVATGFLVRNFYRWNYNSWLKDNVEHTGKAFLGLTFNCAHCHDHKYDPIRHEDYFAFRAIFEPLEMRHDRVPGEPDPGPYPKYDYGKAYKPIVSGMVRVFDEKLDAQTFLYTRGESRNIVPDRPPIPPGMPDFLGGGRFRNEPIELPAEAAYPGLKSFVRHEAAAPRDAAVVTAEKAVSSSRARALTAAQALVDAEARRSPGNPRAFDDPLSAVLAFATDAPVTPELVAARNTAESARRTLLVDEAELDYARASRASLQARFAADDARFGQVKGDVKTLGRAASRAERLAIVARKTANLARAEKALSPASAKPPAELANASALRDAARTALNAARAEAEKESADYTPLSPAYPTRSTGRRATLARWITSRTNPLAARVAVNHLWRWHFGAPLVATTHDFGRNGTPPTHPELLDWLAVELMEPTAPGVSSWSMKSLHRRIVTSDAYRMASHANLADHPNHIIDPENRDYWHFPASRLEAEEVRDALLHIAGALDTTSGGPDIDYAKGMTSRRRSLYFTHHGEARMPFLELFDAPDACDAYRRTTSVVPQQALALVNNVLLLDLSRGLSERLWSEAKAAGKDEPAHTESFLTAAFEQILARAPSPRERELSRSFLARQTSLLERASDSTPKVPAVDPPARARRDLVHALFSQNDFLTIH